MSYSGPARTTTRRIPRIPGAGLLVVIAAALGYPLVASPTSTAASAIDVLHSEDRGALGEADGAFLDATTVFDDEIPGVANLDPALLGALCHEAISSYGSEKEAARWWQPLRRPYARSKDAAVTSTLGTALTSTPSPHAGTRHA